jgi:hypothetical protein
VKLYHLRAWRARPQRRKERWVRQAQYKHTCFFFCFWNAKGWQDRYTFRKTAQPYPSRCTGPIATCAREQGWNNIIQYRHKNVFPHGNQVWSIACLIFLFYRGYGLWINSVCDRDVLDCNVVWSARWNKQSKHDDCCLRIWYRERRHERKEKLDLPQKWCFLCRKSYHMHRTEIQHTFEDMHFVQEKVPRVLALLLDCSPTSSPRKRSGQRRCAAHCAP